ncbi:MAG: ComF family protein [Oscillospiraceae bacterium]|jgi:ComF family protein|nr:ComF family protein [Oscillospiraceae bacterium]
MSAALTLLDLLFPPKCPFCQKLLRDPRAPYCEKCAEALPRLEGEAGIRHGDYFDLCVSPLEYRGKVREAILRFKFSGGRENGAPFGAAIAHELFRRGITADLITWIPLGRKRRRERGYNQAELIARSCAKALGISAVQTLARARDTAANTTLDSASARQSNVRDAFCVTANVRGVRALLVDDVITTGATLGEAARAILLAGAESVICATFASTRIGQE